MYLNAPVSGFSPVYKKNNTSTEVNSHLQQKIFGCGEKIKKKKIKCQNSLGRNIDKYSKYLNINVNASS